MQIVNNGRIISALRWAQIVANKTGKPMALMADPRGAIVVRYASGVENPFEIVNPAGGVK